MFLAIVVFYDSYRTDTPVAPRPFLPAAAEIESGGTGLELVAVR